MGKSKEDRRVNKIVQQINKELREDVFKDRFWVRQVAKQKSDDGLTYYLYEMIDNQEPNRNAYVNAGWIWGGSQFLASDIYEAINDFIIRSNFWSEYFNDPERYSFDADYYAHEFYSLRSKR